MAEKSQKKGFWSFLFRPKTEEQSPQTPRDIEQDAQQTASSSLVEEVPATDASSLADTNKNPNASPMDAEETQPATPIKPLEDTPKDQEALAKSVPPLEDESVPEQSIAQETLAKSVSPLEDESVPEQSIAQEALAKSVPPLENESVSEQNTPQEALAKSVPPLEEESVSEQSITQEPIGIQKPTEQEALAKNISQEAAPLAATANENQTVSKRLRIKGSTSRKKPLLHPGKKDKSREDNNTEQISPQEFVEPEETPSEHKIVWEKLGQADEPDTQKKGFFSGIFSKKKQPQHEEQTLAPIPEEDDFSLPTPPKASDAFATPQEEPRQEAVFKSTETPPISQTPEFSEKPRGKSRFSFRKQTVQTEETDNALPQVHFLEKMGIQGLFVALLFLCLAALPDILNAIQGIALFCPAEVTHITTYLSAQSTGAWVAPIHTLPAQWPGLTWLTGLLALVVPSEALLLAVTSLCCSALAVIALWMLCRSAGYGSSGATAAAFVLLCTPLFAPVVHFYGPAALAAAFVLFALVFLGRGWMGEGSWISLPLGFIATALAGLTGGLFHLLLPLLSSIVFLLWCLRYRRAQRSDAIFGFFCFLALLVAWLGFIYVGAKSDVYIKSLAQSSWQKPWPLTQWWLPLLLVVGGSLPWLLALIFPSWFKVLAHAWKDLKASRNEHAIASFIWFSFVLGALLILCMPKAMVPSCSICLLCLLSALLGKSIVRLSKAGARLFIFTLMLLCFGLGLLLIAIFVPAVQAQMALYLPWMPPKEILAMLPKLYAVPALGALLLVTGIVFKKFLKSGDTGRLLLTSLLVATIFSVVSAYGILPALAKQPFARLQTLAQIKNPPKPAPKAPEKAAQPASVAPAKAPEKAAQPASEAPAKPAEKAAPAPAKAPEKAAQPASEAPAKAPEKAAQPASETPAKAPEKAAPAPAKAPEKAAQPASEAPAKPAEKAAPAKAPEKAAQPASEAPAKPAEKAAPAKAPEKAAQPASEAPAKAPEKAAPAKAPEKAAQPASEAPAKPAPAKAPEKAAQPASEAPAKPAPAKAPEKAAQPASEAPAKPAPKAPEKAVEAAKKASQQKPADDVPSEVRGW
ncbi:MAG: hypothetical protein IJS54_04120 [Desulfovibrio sp.]|nr:hypothetical protein [Desulfovibrio sp.]